MSTPTVVFVLPAVVCVLSWLGLSAAGPRRWLAGTPPLLALLTRLGAAAAVASLALYALALAGVFSAAAITAGTVALALVGVWATARGAPSLGELRRPRGLAAILVALAAGALAVNVLAAAAPPSSPDALMYHLAVPERWLELGRAEDPFWRWEAFNPSAVQMLYAQALALSGGEAAAVLHALFGVGCALGVFGLSRTLGAPSLLAGASGAALFVLQGLFTWEATSAFIDLGMTFYVLLAVWHAVLFGASGGSEAAAWSGFLAGAAAGTKYVGALAAAIVLLGLVATAAGRRALPIAAAALGLALLVASPWYVKNMLVAGNPVYPLIAGGRWWTESAAELTRSDYGVGGYPLRLPLLPLDLFVHGEAFDGGRYVGPAVFLLAPGALLLRSAFALPLLGGVMIYLGAWSQLSAQARFLLPALAVLAALAGAAVPVLIERRRSLHYGVLGVLCVTVLLWLVPTAALTRQLLPPTLGLEERSAFLERLTGTYGALHGAAEVVDGTLATAGYEFTFHYPKRAIQLGEPAFGRLVPRDEYVRRLELYGVTHVLVREPLDSRHEVRPVRDCLRHVRAFDGRYVTSRALAKGEPMTLGLYSAAACAAD